MPGMLSKVFHLLTTQHDNRDANDRVTIVNLPADVIMLIIDELPLHSVTSLAYTSKHFQDMLGYSFRLLNLTENLSQKLRFLLFLDPHLPEMLLCTVCAKFYNRSPDPRPVELWHRCWVDRHHVGPHNNIRIHRIQRTSMQAPIRMPMHAWQQVMRARHYGDERYGKPIEDLKKSFEVSGWNVFTDAVFTKQNSLIIRITSIRQVSDLEEADFTLTDAELNQLDPQPIEPRFPFSFCDCAKFPWDKASDVVPILEHCKAALRYSRKDCKLIRPSQILFGSNRCPKCLALVQVSFRCVDPDPSGACAHYGHDICIKRYHDLGPVSTFASRLFWSVEDVWRYYEVGPVDNFANREFWTEEDDARLAGTGYVRASCGALQYVGPELESERFLQAKHCGLGSDRFGVAFRKLRQLTRDILG